MTSPRPKHVRDLDPDNFRKRDILWIAFFEPVTMPWIVAAALGVMSFLWILRVMNG